MRKIYKNLLLLLLLLGTITMVACGGDSEASNDTEVNEESNDSSEVITLKVADYLSTEHYISKEGAVYWMEKAEELSEGKLKFDYYPTEQLGKADKMLEAVKNGVTDVAYTGIGYHSDQLTLSGVGELPGAFETSVEGTKAYRDIVEGFLLEEEFLTQGIRPMFTVAAAPFQIMSVDTSIENIDDVKGLKVSSAGGSMDITVEEIGSTPVSMPAPELYTALERNTINAITFSIASIPPYQFQEILDDVTTNANVGSFIIPYVINEQVWKDLPEDVKDAMYQAGLDTEQHLSEYIDQETEDTLKMLEEEGINLVEYDEKDKNKLEDIYSNVWDKWEEKVNKRNIDGSGARESFEEALNK